jgi:hypothetical protein
MILVKHIRVDLMMMHFLLNAHHVLLLLLLLLLFLILFSQVFPGISPLEPMKC